MKRGIRLLIIISLIMTSFICTKNVYALDNFCGIELADKVIVNINFEVNGGDEINSLNYCMDCGISKFKLPEPKRRGYIFEGWYADRNFKIRISDTFNKETDAKKLLIVPDSIGCDVNKVHTTLYAKWSSDNSCETQTGNITVNFETNGADKIDPIYICESCDSKKLSLPVPKKENYIFLGWYLEDSLLTKLPNEMIDSNELYSRMKLEYDNNDKCSFDRHTTLYARWVDNEELIRLIKDSIDNNLYYLSDIISNNK